MRLFRKRRTCRIFSAQGPSIRYETPGVFAMTPPRCVSRRESFYSTAWRRFIGPHTGPAPLFLYAKCVFVALIGSFRTCITLCQSIVCDAGRSLQKFASVLGGGMPNCHVSAFRRWAARSALLSSSQTVWACRRYGVRGRFRMRSWCRRSVRVALRVGRLVREPGRCSAGSIAID